MSKINEYYILGRSGLRVSPLCLGTMTFGTEWKWGTSIESANEIFNTYVEAGGNFIDTADGYTDGTSEEMLGHFIKEKNNRDKIVLATKFTFSADIGNPNAGGNGRKNIIRALEGSLKRLKTDYIDLYWLHAWDTLTPVEEVMNTLNALVNQGKIRYIGLSDCPAWYVSRAQTMATIRGMEKVSAIQMEYNLTERNLELEYTYMAQEMGFGICAWSPLGGGFLTGKYKKNNLGEGRLKIMQDSGFKLMQKFTQIPKNWEILDALIGVSKEIGKTPAQVALNFISKQPGVTSVLVGATKVAQLQENINSLDFDIPTNLWTKLNDVSKPFIPTPYTFFDQDMQSSMRGDVKVSFNPPNFYLHKY